LRLSLSLITVLVSFSTGCAALREASLIPTLVPLFKDLDLEHSHLVGAALHIFEAFMDYSNLTACSVVAAESALLYSYKHVFNGFSAHLSLEEFSVLSGKLSEDELPPNASLLLLLLLLGTSSSSSVSSLQ
jgi:hypothetical protein